MPLTFSILNGSTIETGPEIVRAITDSHFGGNVLVNNAERAQISSGWGFGRSIADANMKNLRYPGGTVTETLFDMTNPDAPMRGTTPLLWQTQFLQFASEIGASATIVIPTRCGFTQSAGASLVAGNYGHRAVSEEYSQSVQRYVFDTIRNAANQENPVRISCFEIGNEFWASGQMTASEYGKVAASALRAAQAGIDHAIAAGYVSSTSQPELLVQTISAAGYMSPNSSSDVYVSSGEVYQSISLIPEGQLYELATISGQGNARAQLLEIVRVLNDASVSHLIDGMVDHYYNASGFAQVDTGEQFIFQQFNYAEARLGREVGTLSRYVTEWNTKRTVDTSDGGRENNPEVAHNRGLPQAGMLVEMFFEMLTHGVTSANVWPLWFPSGNSTSLFDSETFATRVPSAIFQLMQESLIGTRPILDSEIEIDSVRLDSHFFSSDAKIVFFSQNRSEVPLHDFILGLDGLGDSTLRANLDTRQYFLAITELSSSLGGQFCSGANGEDVAPVLTYSNGAIGSGSLLQISMSNFTSTVDSLSAIDPMAILRVEITFISEGSDVIIGRAGNDTIFGGGGDDSILGSSGVDRLHGQAGNDTLEGGPGNDHLWGGEGADRLIGGDGQEIDYARYDDANWGNLIIRLDNPALNTGAAQGDRYVGIEGLIGGLGNDTMFGDAAANHLLGARGSDRLYGQAGNDTLEGGLGNDHLWGGEGADRLIGGDGQEIDYARYDDANWGNLIIRLDNPALNTGAAQGDRYVGIEGLIGGLGNDTMFGDAAANHLLGARGSDRLYGQAGNDTLEGGLGNDHLWGGEGADRLIGGDGQEIDYARYDDANWGNLIIRLDNPALNTGAAQGDRYVGIEGLIGGLGNDTMFGDAAANHLLGARGSDRLYGQAGNDTLEGGPGNDTVEGGPGNDHLWGGEGADLFVFNTSLGKENIDRLFDFSTVDDTLLLHCNVFIELATGFQRQEVFVIGNTAENDAHRLVYDIGSGNLFYDSDGIDSADSVLFAVFEPGTALSAADFCVF